MENCCVDVPNLVLEVGLAARVVERQQDAADWLQKFRRGAPYLASQILAASGDGEPDEDSRPPEPDLEDRTEPRDSD